MRASFQLATEFLESGTQPKFRHAKRLQLIVGAKGRLHASTIAINIGNSSGILSLNSKAAAMVYLQLTYYQLNWVPSSGGPPKKKDFSGLCRARANWMNPG